MTQLALFAPKRRTARGPVFYQTTALTVSERNAAIARAEAQDERVLAVYRCAGRPLSPSEAHAQLEACGSREPLTSIRRAIHTLTAAGALVKLSVTRTGIYGAREHLWALSEGGRAA